MDCFVCVIWQGDGGCYVVGEVGYDCDIGVFIVGQVQVFVQVFQFDVGVIGGVVEV